VKHEDETNPRNSRRRGYVEYVGMVKLKCNNSFFFVALHTHTSKNDPYIPNNETLLFKKTKGHCNVG